MLTIVKSTDKWLRALASALIVTSAFLILAGAGVLFAFATLFEAREAIREGLGVKLTHGDTTVEIHDLDGSPSETKNDEQ